MRSLLVLPLVVVLLAGCDKGTPDPVVVTQTIGAPSGAPSTASPAASLAPKSDVYVNTTNSQADGGFVGAASDVASQDCSGEGGTWTGWGTVLNSASEDANYRVWVAFVDAEGETVGLVESDFDGVKPGETGEYTASMPYTGADVLTCVLRVERRTA